MSANILKGQIKFILLLMYQIFYHSACMFSPTSLMFSPSFPLLIGKQKTLASLKKWGGGCDL